MRRLNISRAARLLPLLLLAALVLGLTGLDFASRRGRPTLNVSVENLSLKDGRFAMTAGQGGNSGITFRRYSWEIEDGTLYVTLFCGLSRRGFCQDRLTVAIEDESRREVRQICLRDRSTAKLLYSR